MTQSAPGIDLERQRLAELHNYQILDSAPESSFDRLTRIAASIFEMPISLVTFIDEHRQWIKSAVGIDLKETARQDAFCVYPVSTCKPVQIVDASIDPRFKNNRLVSGDPLIRFYAGAPLISRAGYALGAICVIDRKPRELSASQMAILEDLAATAAEMLEARRLCAAYEDLAQRAFQSDAAKSAFIANMSHELRTPLNAIIGFSDMMQKEIFGPIGVPKYLEYASDINKSGEYLLEIINEILDLAKIEAGKIEVNLERFHLASIVDHCSRLIEEAICSKKLSLQINLQPANIEIEQDRRLLTQILVNLLTNSIKFTPEHGAIRLEARRVADNSLYIEVKDTGIGMNEQEIDRMLKPFEQASQALNREHDGLGLGLALVSSFVKALGGTLKIESKKGLGTTVGICLPLQKPETIKIAVS